LLRLEFNTGRLPFFLKRKNIHIRYNFYHGDINISLKFIVSTSGVSSSVEGSCSVSPSETDSDSSDSEPVI